MAPWCSARFQIPVGFGGFHVALLGEPFPLPWSRFVLVYDCGALTQLLACAWAARVGRAVQGDFGQIDLAVLSHTDFDHVCAIDSLAKSVHIDTLMLPHLSLHFREAQLAAGFEKLPAWYRRFVRDPAIWAREVGIANVILVDEGSAEGPAPERAAPRPLPGEGHPERPVLMRGRTSRAAPALAAGMTIMSSGDELTIRTTHPDVGWFVIPIVAPIKAPVQLEAELAAEVTGHDAAAFYAGLSLKETGSLRNRLARIYRRHWSSTNRSSVMLLIVPFNGDRGWLCTGDADLTSAEVQSRIQQHGAPLFPRVDAIHVPHHGSPHNCNAQAVAFLGALAGNRRFHWVVSSGKNRWKYPSRSVEAACGPLNGPIQASSLWSDMYRF